MGKVPLRLQISDHDLADLKDILEELDLVHQRTLDLNYTLLGLLAAYLTGVRSVRRVGEPLEN